MNRPFTRGNSASPGGSQRTRNDTKTQEGHAMSARHSTRKRIPLLWVQMPLVAMALPLTALSLHRQMEHGPDGSTLAALILWALFIATTRGGKR